MATVFSVPRIETFQLLGCQRSMASDRQIADSHGANRGPYKLTNPASNSFNHAPYLTVPAFRYGDLQER
jgi:hypothetical protein